MSESRDFIGVYPNAIPNRLCDDLIAAFEAHPATAPGHTGHGLDTSKKRSTDLMLDEHDELKDLRQTLLKHTFDNVLAYFDEYYLALIGAISVQLQDEQGQAQTLSPENYAALGKPRIRDLVGYLFRSGSVNVQKYEANKGGYPHWHSEQFPQHPHNEALHRVVLYMYYLNDVSEGGETEFYYQGRSIQPSKGTMVIAPAGFTHTHRGNKPINQDKYIATSWILFNRSEKLYGEK